MTQRDDTEVRTPAEESPAAAAGAAHVPQQQGTAAVAEGAEEAVDPPAAERPAPAVDPSAATPDRQAAGDKAAAATEERPEILVAGAFVGGLVAAMVLKRVARG